MALVRDGSDLRAVARAYLSQVHPIFMLPPLAASVFGAILVREIDPVIATIHVIAIFAAVYTAHLKDGYVDFHVRGEDDDHPLTPLGCRVGLVCSTTVFVSCCLVLLVFVDWVLVGLTAPTWFIAYFHAPQLDVNPITATTGYPMGIALAIVGGYYAQAMVIDIIPLGFSVVFLLLLSGIKVIDDAQDYDYDRSINKRTLAVVLGHERAWIVAYGLMGCGLGGVILLAVGGVFPPSTAIAALAFVPIGLIAVRAEPEISTMLLIRGSYVFLAILVGAVWFEPLASIR